VKKKLTLTLLLTALLISFVWAGVDLWNEFHLVTLVFLFNSPWLLAVALGSLNLFENQPVRPKIKILLIVMSLIGIGAFVYGAFTNSSSTPRWK